MFDMKKFATQAGEVCARVRDAAQEAAPQAKQVAIGVERTAQVFVAALKGTPIDQSHFTKGE
jgi:hypothetical protein